jgi:hypothetical protein
MGAADLVASLTSLRIGRVFVCGEFPTPWSDNHVGHGNGSEHSVLKAQQDDGSILNSVPAGRTRLDCLHGDDVAAEIAETVDVMNEIEEDMSCALLAPPGNVEYSSGLKNQQVP